ncbi:MAG: hypothetical protein ACYC61_08890 [Isosphaeraceae bacterium]
MIQRDDEGGDPTRDRLAAAVTRWLEGGNAGPLARWLARELDGDGEPRRPPVGDWPGLLEELARLRAGSGSWPAGCEDAIDGLVLAVLRFSRPDGSLAFSGEGEGAGTASRWPSGDWAKWYRGTGIGRVLAGWSGRPRARPGEQAPPLPAWSAADRVLAVLRADWRPDGDFLAVEHREPSGPCRFELYGGGRTWLGPDWGGIDPEGTTGAGASATRTRVRPSQWITGSTADLLEWTIREGDARITRSAVLLRGRRMALISAQAERPAAAAAWPGSPALALTIAPDLTAGPVRESRALALTGPGRRGAAQVLPIALPCRPYPTDRGSLRAEGGRLVLRVAPAGRRCWLPLLVSWDTARHRSPPTWRVLTVSERARAVGTDRAVAVRVSWGRDETYVVYRSLGPPARRAFLGHQTAARFLIARFDADGDVEPILTVE